jgi:hypothetical protein
MEELDLYHVELPDDPSDGGVNVLCSLFARSDTTLTKVTLDFNCTFGNEEETLQLYMAFQTNATVTDLGFRDIINLIDAALGGCLASLMLNMPQLQKLECSASCLSMDGARALQPGLRTNLTLKELDLCGYQGLWLAADALEGSTTM